MLDWGPLSAIFELPGKQIIVFLKKINTNNKIGESKFQFLASMNKGSELIVVICR